MFRDRPVCAACGVALDRAVVHGYTIWACPSGHGAALDTNMTTDVTIEATVAAPIATGATSGGTPVEPTRATTGRDRRSANSRRCSHCRSTIDTFDRDIVRCPHCGVVWFDCPSGEQPPTGSRFGDSIQRPATVDADRDVRLAALVRRFAASGAGVR